MEYRRGQKHHEDNVNICLLSHFGFHTEDVSVASKI